MALIFQPLWYRGFSRELLLVDFLHYLTLQDFFFFFFFLALQLSAAKNSLKDFEVRWLAPEFAGFLGS